MRRLNELLEHRAGDIFRFGKLISFSDETVRRFAEYFEAEKGELEPGRSFTGGRLENARLRRILQSYYNTGGANKWREESSASEFKVALERFESSPSGIGLIAKEAKWSAINQAFSKSPFNVTKLLYQPNFTLMRNLGVATVLAGGALTPLARPLISEAGSYRHELSLTPEVTMRAAQEYRGHTRSFLISQPQDIQQFNNTWAKDWFNAPPTMSQAVELNSVQSNGRVGGQPRNLLHQHYGWGAPIDPAQATKADVIESCYPELLPEKYRVKHVYPNAKGYTYGVHNRLSVYESWIRENGKDRPLYRVSGLPEELVQSRVVNALGTPEKGLFIYVNGKKVFLDTKNPQKNPIVMTPEPEGLNIVGKHPDYSWPPVPGRSVNDAIKENPALQKLAVPLSSPRAGARVVEQQTAKRMGQEVGSHVFGGLGKALRDLFR
jgi:hypothetical protein